MCVVDVAAGSTRSSIRAGTRRPTSVRRSAPSVDQSRSFAGAHTSRLATTNEATRAARTTGMKIEKVTSTTTASNLAPARTNRHVLNLHHPYYWMNIFLGSSYVNSFVPISCPKAHLTGRLPGIFERTFYVSTSMNRIYCVALSYPRQNHLLWCMHCFSSKASLRVAVVSVQVIFVIFYILLSFH